MKWILWLAFGGVLLALLLAGVFMVRGKEGSRDPNPSPGQPAKSRAMMRALAARVALSAGVFLLILLGWAMGWIEPHDLR
jgi:hypothetical protein